MYIIKYFCIYIYDKNKLGGYVMCNNNNKQNNKYNTINNYIYVITN